MKTLIWYRDVLRYKIIEKLYKINYIKSAEQQEEYFRQEEIWNKVTNGPSCIDSLDEDHFGLNTKVITKIPPNEYSMELPDLITLMGRKAKKICSLNKPIDILWSGGIDSTVTLLMMRNYAEKDQLSIIMSEGSIEEHPTLYNSLVKYMPCKINRNKNFRSEIEKDKITVNSNAADNNYGSPKGRLQSFQEFEYDPKEFVFKFKCYPRWRYGHFNVNMRDLGGVVFDRVLLEKSEFEEQEMFIPHCQSLYSDWDVMKWFINRQLEREIPFGSNSKKDFENDNFFKEQKNIWRQLPEEERLDPEHTIIPKIPYIRTKMELRNYIVKESGDKNYAYGKEDVASYAHGQIDMFVEKEINPLGFESLNVAVCDDGEIIRRDQLNDIDPFDFITP